MMKKSRRYPASKKEIFDAMAFTEALLGEKKKLTRDVLRGIVKTFDDKKE